MKKKLIIILVVIALISISIGSIFMIKSKRNDNNHKENKIETSILEKNKIRVSGHAWGVGINQDGKEGSYSKDFPAVDYDLELNKEVKYEEGNSGLKFTITEILEDGIKIKTEDDFSEKKENGSYKLLDYKKEFFIENNNKIKLATPTMDAGETYTIEIAR